MLNLITLIPAPLLISNSYQQYNNISCYYYNDRNLIGIIIKFINININKYYFSLAVVYT